MEASAGSVLEYTFGKFVACPIFDPFLPISGPSAAQTPSTFQLHVESMPIQVQVGDKGRIDEKLWDPIREGQVSLGNRDRHSEKRKHNEMGRLLNRVRPSDTSQTFTGADLPHSERNAGLPGCFAATRCNCLSATLHPQRFQGRPCPARPGALRRDQEPPEWVLPVPIYG